MTIFCRLFGFKSGPDGSRRPSGFIWTKFQVKPSIFVPFRTKFDVFGPDWNFGRPGFGLGLALDKPHCFWEAPSKTSKSVLSQQQTSVLSQQQTSVLSQQQTSVLSQQKTSILSQQMSQQKTKVPVGAQIIKNGPNRVQNRPFGLKLGPNES